MTTETLRMAAVFPSTAERLYAAWLDALEHSKMTGSPATVDARVGGRHTAWDGYIEGEIVELEPGRRLVQTWRTGDFPSDSPDSLVEIRFEPSQDGSVVEIVHTDIPDGQRAMYERGWDDFYFLPMRRYFRAPKAAAPAAAKKKPAKRRAATKRAATARPKATAKAKKRARASGAKKTVRASAAKKGARAATKKATAKRTGRARTASKKTTRRR